MKNKIKYIVLLIAQTFKAKTKKAINAYNASDV
jgi:hypothetical protein